MEGLYQHKLACTKKLRADEVRVMRIAVRFRILFSFAV